ncbi:unnamed protein product [Soboliphyme baturini]|uniref:C2H2-type domain-containing protein n=1 Tax=Soboliphyme baturini TaxID=241478 RepID=A0A183IA24_9BILA|nr:unnamed protein product [Soboliphyme baturini]
MSLLFRNICMFDGCHLEFASACRLVQHVEEAHVVEEMAKQYKTDAGQLTCFPLSMVCRQYHHLPDEKAKPLSPVGVLLSSRPQRKRFLPFLSPADRVLQATVGHSLVPADRDTAPNIVGATGMNLYPC